MDAVWIWRDESCNPLAIHARKRKAASGRTACCGGSGSKQAWASTGGREDTDDKPREKAWLGRYRQLDQRIGQLAEEISLWRSRAQKITPSYEGQPRGGGEDRLQSAVEMILQLEEEADREIDALVGLKGEIRRAIRTVEDSTLRMLLEYRYIHGLTWEQIADRMSYNEPMG